MQQLRILILGMSILATGVGAEETGSDLVRLYGAYGFPTSGDGFKANWSGVPSFQAQIVRNVRQGVSCGIEFLHSRFGQEATGRESSFSSTGMGVVLEYELMSGPTLTISPVSCCRGGLERL